MTALPTRKQEAWRYADLKAVEAHWPPPPARLISVAASFSDEQIIRIGEGGLHEILVDLAPGASLSLVVAITSPEYARVAVQANLRAGAHFDLGGVLLGGGDSGVELLTDVRHLEPGATSRQRVRLVVDDRATGSFLGRIAVARDAQQTDAAQSARALVLKRTATANLKPELEIFADDVKCAHGCTVGELDKTALFYLESRGISPAEAQSLLTQAFVADAFSAIQDGPTREALEEEARTWLGARVSAPAPAPAPRTGLPR